MSSDSKKEDGASVIGAISNNFKIAMAPIRWAINLLIILLCLWVSFYALGYLLPRYVADYSRFITNEAFARFDFPSPFMFEQQQQTYVAADINSSQWFYVCQPEAALLSADQSISNPYYRDRASPALSSWSALDQRSYAAMQPILAYSTRLARQIESSKQELEDLRLVSRAFVTTIILVGFATTVIAAANSSDLWKDRPRTSLTIKALAIIFPAMTTALAAIQTVYAAPDALSRKAQLVFTLVNLQTEMTASLTQGQCPVDGKLSDALRASLADWTKRFGTTIATAEFTQTTSETRRTTPEQSPEQTKPADPINAAAPSRVPN
jgi:hypothetical protein